MHPKAPRPMPDLSERDRLRFLGKVGEPHPETGCMEWTAAKDHHGYGRFNIGGKVWRAHRVALVIAGVEVPAHLIVDHLCRNTSCVNPGHLEPVTYQENSLRGITVPAARAAKTHCPQGHEYSSENTYRDSKNRRYCRTCGRDRKRTKYQKEKETR